MQTAVRRDEKIDQLIDTYRFYIEDRVNYEQFIDKKFWKSYLYVMVKYGVFSNIEFVKMINRFGAEGGFKLILERISRKDKWLPIEVLVPYVSGICNLSNIMTEQFAKDYIPPLTTAVKENLLNSPEQNIRNFSKELMDVLFLKLRDILTLQYKPKIGQQILFELMLSVGWICFSSNFLDKRINGLKIIQDTIKMS